MTHKCSSNTVHIWSKNDRILLCGEVDQISHFGVVRDYTITLSGGQRVVLPARVIADIVAHENAEAVKE